MLTSVFNSCFFLALVAAVPVPSETESARDDNKYAKDRGVSRSVLSYIFGAAGCLVVLGVMYFAWVKYRRGERICPGVQRKAKHDSARREATNLHHVPAERSRGTERSVISMYGTDNPYGWPAQQATPVAAVEDRWVQDFAKPLPPRPVQAGNHQKHGVKKPAPVARSATGIGRKLAPKAPVRTIFPDGSGYYRVPLEDTRAAAPAGNYHLQSKQVNSHRYR